ncbi:dynein light chain type 2 [Plasmodium gonderi]|uniref:Dynein light chain type 2 n=1 Tax=Plasmodium gonderi TaxID=77519 RepID=A0A1Y1JEE9_PLAGO|nr:dynein light chain type 2 [Plasmodium gonderi]GAW80911.1 dynein light chain type 2 [Plasmodium gonderi]
MDGSGKGNTKNTDKTDNEKNTKEENKINMDGFQFFANTCEEKLRLFLENYFSTKTCVDLTYKAENQMFQTAGSSVEANETRNGKGIHKICTDNDLHGIQHDTDDSSNENDNHHKNYFEKNNPIKSNYDKMAINLVDDVQQFMKPYVNERYKIVVQAIIGENKKQGIHIASKSLWNVETDNYISAKYVNDFIFVSVMVFLLYNE